jgi:Short C-terminal domain
VAARLPNFASTKSRACPGTWRLVRESQSAHEQSFAVSDAAEQIKTLPELRDSGILSDEEFEAKKAELLKRILDRASLASDWQAPT